MLADDTLATQAIFAVKQLFHDLKGLRKLKKDRLTEYLLIKERSKKVLPYSHERLQDRNEALHWLTRNLDTSRPFHNF